mmetsp:Transcript_12201/g.34424  ORF Transcript_12201/g.34424 Transcript_12201/m.34424 type:complete len:238 (-) Transcript_12201:703-1416(-)
MSESSPARTLAATTRASFLELPPGASVWLPDMPRRRRAARWEGRWVPPPTVPTSMDGMETEQYMLPSSFSSNWVMQLDDSTTWAGSWPVAMKIAATMFAAWALKPPSVPAMADPMRFLLTLSSMTCFTDDLSTDSTTFFVSTASAMTDCPRPMVQLTAEDFLSVHTLPDTLQTSRLGKYCFTQRSASSTPLDTMFMPIASPVLERKRRYRLRPARIGVIDTRRPNREVELNAAATST